MLRVDRGGHSFPSALTPPVSISSPSFNSANTPRNDHHPGMELKNLSTNWRKLQEKLKEDPGSTVPNSKVNDQDARHGVKRRRAEKAEGSKPKKLHRDPKRRKMLDEAATSSTSLHSRVEKSHNGIEVSPKPSETLVMKSSTRSLSNKDGCINEGMSPTFVSITLSSFQVLGHRLLTVLSFAELKWVNT